MIKLLIITIICILCMGCTTFDSYRQGTIFGFLVEVDFVDFQKTSVAIKDANNNLAVKIKKTFKF